MCLVYLFNVVFISLHTVSVWLYPLACLSVVSWCVSVARWDVGVCRLVNQLQWKTLLIQTPGEALIQALSGNRAAESPATHRKRERDINRTESSWLCQKDQWFVWMRLPLSRAPTLAPECQAFCEWDRQTHRHTRTGTGTHVHKRYHP